MKTILLILLCVVMMPVVGYGEDCEYEFGSYIGIYIDGREGLDEFLITLDFPYEITIPGDKTEDSISMIIESAKDFPKHSIKTDCPKLNCKISECWFIKYDDEGEQ